MKKIVCISLFLCLYSTGIWSQHTQMFTNPDALFEKGKELFVAEKFAASYRSFQEFLKSPDQNQVGQIQEAEYYLAANAFELRQKDAPILLKDHLLQYPYTPFLDRINDMLGIIETENKKFDQALVYFNQVKENHLGKRERVEFLFLKGYCFVETKNYPSALTIFTDLKEQDTRYKLSSTYYYAYSEYCLLNYEKALPEFLKLETNPVYKNIVPYSICTKTIRST
jgi:tetratricopeptide (TPR) repeat protein